MVGGNQYLEFFQIAAFYGFAQRFIGFCVILVRRQETDLESVPLLLVLQNTVFSELLEKRLSDFFEIIAPQVVEVGIAQNGFEEV